MDLKNYELFTPSGLPVVGAAVSLYAAQTAHPNTNNPTATTVTDGNGMWQFLSLADAEWDIKIVYDGRIKWYKGKTFPNIGAGSIARGNIASQAVNTAQLATDAVTTVKITDANVTTAKIADANVTTAKILDANVTTAKLAANAVTKVSSNFSAGTVSISSTSYVDALTTTFTTSGGDIIVFFNAAAFISSGTPTNIVAGVRVDAGADAEISYRGVNAAAVGITGFTYLTGISAASHTFAFRAKNGAAGTTGLQDLSILVIEVKK